VKARTGRIITDHSEIETPVFMPVGTSGAVKAVENRELEEMDCRIILGNSYHLYLRPGTEILKKAGGIHSFMNWKKSLLTDSGGFQVFSMTSLKKVSDEGVVFTSHLDGSKHIFTPEKVIDIERSIGSDILMPLDECLPYPSDRKIVEKSIRRTAEWERRCKTAFDGSGQYYKHRQYMFSINQGSTFKDLRKQSIETLNELETDGNAIGGLAVGEKSGERYEIVDFCTDYMTADKPRYLMGVGTPLDILECVERGVDMFDCVMPTRNARHGRLFTTYGELNMKNAKYADDFRFADDECRTYTSENFSLSYIRHLFMSKEIIAMQLASIHNLGFYLYLMKKIREAIIENRFLKFKKEFTEKYSSKLR